MWKCVTQMPFKARNGAECPLAIGSVQGGLWLVQNANYFVEVDLCCRGFITKRRLIQKMNVQEMDGSKIQVSDPRTRSRLEPPVRLGLYLPSRVPSRDPGILSDEPWLRLYTMSPCVLRVSGWPFQTNWGPRRCRILWMHWWKTFWSRCWSHGSFYTGWFQPHNCFQPLRWIIDIKFKTLSHRSKPWWIVTPVTRRVAWNLNKQGEVVGLRPYSKIL